MMKLKTFPQEISVKKKARSAEPVKGRGFNPILPLRCWNLRNNEQGSR